MQKLLFFALGLFIVTSLHADEVRRDASGRIISTTTKNPGGSETVRDASGRIVEQKTTTGGTTVVRDANGNIIRTETRR